MRSTRFLLVITLSLVCAGNVYSGTLASVDPAKSYFDLLKDRASKGDTKSAVCLGEIYQRGIIVNVDLGQALEWFKSAADAGDPLGKTKQAVLLSVYSPSGKPDPQAAMATLKELAEKGYAPAATEVGVLYAAGVGVPADEQQARNWYLKGAAANDPMAEVRLAIQDRRGYGVPVDPDAANNLLEKVRKQEIDCLPEYLYLVPYIINANMGPYNKEDSSDSVTSKGVFDFRYSYENGKLNAISITNASDTTKKKWLAGARTALLPPWPRSYSNGDRQAGFYFDNNVQIELPSSPFQHFREEVYKSIRQSIVKYGVDVNGTATVDLELKGNKPISVLVSRSSGQKEVDAAAVRALANAQYPAPPAGYENEMFHQSFVVNFNHAEHAPAAASSSK